MTKQQLFKLLDNPKTPESEIAKYGEEFVTAASDFIIQDRMPSCVLGCAVLYISTVVIFALISILYKFSFFNGTVDYGMVAEIVVPGTILMALAITLNISSRPQGRVARARTWLTLSNNNLEIGTAIRVLTTKSINTSEQYPVTMSTMARLREILQGQTGNDFHRIPVAERNRLRSLIMVNDSELHATMNIEILRILGEARDRFSRDNIEALTKNPARNQYEQAVKEMAGWVMETYFNYPVDQHPAEMLLRSSEVDTGESVLLRPAGFVDTAPEVLLRPSDREGPS